MVPHSAVAQDETTDGIIARMEFDRLRLYSGVGVNLAERLQLARRQVAAMVGAGPGPTSALRRGVCGGPTMPGCPGVL